MFVDRLTLFVEGGRGGAGAVSFRREKYVPRGGPDGGDGGNGGSVLIRADSSYDNLAHLMNRKFWRAAAGASGQSANRSGLSGEDIVIAVPPGTLVRDRDRSHVLRDLRAAGDEVVVARGGKGGKGNKRFATATNRTPRQAEPGQEAESRWVVLELKVIADVGLLGFPNAGKSTLLSRISRARPEIAGYPFTTKYPVLGIVQVDSERSLVVADIPGLIEGAHAGVGLGHEFLRHVERTRVLVHMIEPVSSDPAELVRHYEAIRRELELFNPELARTPELIVVSKLDLTDADVALDNLRRALGKPVIGVSAVTGRGLAELVQAMWQAVQSHPSAPCPTEAATS